MTKSDVKKFLDTHRDIELSAARFERCGRVHV